MIPDFLKPENQKAPDELDLRFGEAIERYHEHFKNSGLITEPSSWSREKWIRVIDECIERNMTIWELFGEEYDPDSFY